MLLTPYFFFRLLDFSKQTLYIGHQYHWPLDAYGKNRSEYAFIDIVRDPAERFQSFFYYNRRKTAKKHSSPGHPMHVSISYSVS